MFYETAKGHGLPRDPFKAIVAPRPIGWISSRSLSGAFNLAPYSFYNAVSTNPHLVWFSSEGEKDSVAFVRESGEFVVNLVGRELAEKMNASSVDAPRGESEFGYAGLTAAPCRLVAAPRVAEAPAALECKLTEIYEPKGLDGRSAGVLVVMGEVVGIHIEDSMLKNGFFDVTRAGNVARLGYRDYLFIDDVFSMVRPRWKAD